MRFLDGLTKVLSNEKIFEHLVKDIVMRTHFVISNMTSSLKAPWIIQGKKVHWISVLGCNNFSPSISLVSLHDSVRVAALSDSGVFPETRLLVQGIE